MTTTIAKPEKARGVKLTMTTLTPSRAGRWLKKRPAKQRPVSKRQVGIYERVMARGEWGVSGDPIGFNKLGEMYDGQHRCLAVVNSGVSIQTMLAEGMPNDAHLYCNLAKKRTDHDRIWMSGYNFTKDHVAIAKKMWLGIFQRRSQELTEGGKLAFLIKYSESILFVSEHLQSKKPTKDAFVRAAVARAHASGVSPAKLQHFCECMNEGDGSPIVNKLREYLIDGATGVARYKKTERAIKNFARNPACKKKIITRNQELFVLEHEVGNDESN